MYKAAKTDAADGNLAGGSAPSHIFYVVLAATGSGGGRREAALREHLGYWMSARASVSPCHLHYWGRKRTSGLGVLVNSF